MSGPDTQKVIDLIASGTRVVVAHSDLGNGKTCFLEGIKCRALESSYDVYTVSTRSSDTFRELDQIISSTTKTLLFIRGLSPIGSTSSSILALTPIRTSRSYCLRAMLFMT